MGLRASRVEPVTNPREEEAAIEMFSVDSIQSIEPEPETDIVISDTFCFLTADEKKKLMEDRYSLRELSIETPQLPCAKSIHSFVLPDHEIEKCIRVLTSPNAARRFCKEDPDFPSQQETNNNQWCRVFCSFRN